jgi:hypothetical protein
MNRTVRGAGLLALLLAALAAPVVAAGGGLPEAKLTVDEDCTTFAFTPDSSRIIFAARRVISTKHLLIQRDDIWEVKLDGGKHRLVDGKKLVKGPVAFGYAIRGIRIAPDGARMTVEMLTRAMAEKGGAAREGELIDLMDTKGNEIKIRGDDSAIDGAFQAAWLGDGETVVYLREAVKPKLLFRIELMRPAAGRGSALFEGQAFSAVAWDPRRNAAVAIERNESLRGPIRLDFLDLQRGAPRELAVLDGFIGHLTISPDGTMAAYFVNGNTLEIREIGHPDQVNRIHLAYGKYRWAADGRRLLLKRGPADKSAELFWVTLPDGKFTPALAGLVFRDFALSPDGRWLAVTEPGVHYLKVYPVEP